MTKNTIPTEVQIQASKEVWMMKETGKTKAEIAREFNISPRSLNRYFDKYKSEFELQSSEEIEAITDVFEPKSNLEKLKSEEYYDSLSTEKKVMLEKYYENKSKNLEIVERIGHRGRAPKGIMPVRDVLMGIIEHHKFAGTLTKANKQNIIEEIMNKTGYGKEHAKFHFSKMKALFGASKLA